MWSKAVMEYSIINTREYTLQEFRDIMNAKHPRLQPTLDDTVAVLPQDTTISELVLAAILYDEHWRGAILWWGHSAESGSRPYRRYLPFNVR